VVLRQLLNSGELLLKVLCHSVGNRAR
jgi:hypothetical protein